MTNEPTFSAIGIATDNIEVRLSYRIVELFSEGLYTSPNKAVEELVANSFDAGAQKSPCTPLVQPARSRCDDCSVRRRRRDGSGGPQTSLAHRHQQQTQAVVTPEEAGSRSGNSASESWPPMCLPTVLLTSASAAESTTRLPWTTAPSTDVSIERSSRRVPIRIALRDLTAEQAKQAVEPWTEHRSVQGNEDSAVRRGNVQSPGHSASCRRSSPKCTRSNQALSDGFCVPRYPSGPTLASG